MYIDNYGRAKIVIAKRSLFIKEEGAISISLFFSRSLIQVIGAKDSNNDKGSSYDLIAIESLSSKEDAS